MWPNATKIITEQIKAKRRQKTFTQQLRDWRNVRHVMPFVLLVLLLLTESAAVYAIQLQYDHSNVHEPPRLDNRFDICVDARPFANSSGDFALCFYYISTLHTSIGYGDVHPCTFWGKLVTIVSSVLGVPLTLLCIGLIGRSLAKCLNWLWRRGHGKEALKTDVFGQEHPLPVWIGFLIALAYLLLFSLYFYVNVLYTMGDDSWLKDNWTFFDSVYFTVTSLFTIGLGDYTPNGKFCYPLTFVLTVLGVSLFSMCITLVIQSMESQFQKVVHLIQDLYDESSDMETENPTALSVHDQPKKPTEDSVNGMLEKKEHKKVAKVVLELWNRDPAGKWLTPLLVHPPFKPARSQPLDGTTADGAMPVAHHPQQHHLQQRSASVANDTSDRATSAELSRIQTRVAKKWKLNTEHMRKATRRDSATNTSMRMHTAHRSVQTETSWLTDTLEEDTHPLGAPSSARSSRFTNRTKNTLVSTIGRESV